MKFIFFVLLVFIISCQTTPSAEEKVNLEFTIKQQSSPVKTSIRGISVVDENVIWLSGAKGTVLKSIDGGTSWEQLMSPDQDSLDFRDVEAFSKEIALVVSAGYPSKVYKTVDGGLNWSQVHENLDSAAFMNSVAFKNEQEGIIFGDQLDGRHLILRTEDQGNTWTRIDSNSLPKPLAIENGFAASGSCITINQDGTYFIGLGGEVVRVFSSKDGKVWQATSTPMQSKSTSFGVYSIAYGNGSIIGVGGDYLTPDSNHFGITNKFDRWELTKGSVNGYRSIIDYSNKGHFWVCGGTNGLDISFDNGNSWEKISSQNINTFQFIKNTTKAIAANGKGKIFLFDIKSTKHKD